MVAYCCFHALLRMRELEGFRRFGKVASLICHRVQRLQNLEIIVGSVRGVTQLLARLVELSPPLDPSGEPHVSFGAISICFEGCHEVFHRFGVVACVSLHEAEPRGDDPKSFRRV